MDSCVCAAFLTHKRQSVFAGNKREKCHHNCNFGFCFSFSFFFCNIVFVVFIPLFLC